jgi:hypothetical protein
MTGLHLIRLISLQYWDREFKSRSRQASLPPKYVLFVAYDGYGFLKLRHVSILQEYWRGAAPSEIICASVLGTGLDYRDYGLGILRADHVTSLYPHSWH